MWICLLLLGAVLPAFADEFASLGHQGELTMKDVDTINQIIPPEDKHIQFTHLFSQENYLIKEFSEYIKKGVTTKGMTFNIYDDDMRNATIALYRVLRNTQQIDKTNYEKIKKWVQYNVNNDILDYTLRLVSLFNSPESSEKFMPPFINKPNYFVGGDTILKAFYYVVNKGKIKDDIKKIYQLLNEDENTVIINTNYSTCNIPLQACIAQLKYFGEDIELNSYYYGLHLLHPFWMTDDELNELNPNHATHYYFAHQQLHARYLLEKEHIDPDKRSYDIKKATPDFLPNLYYENGLSFPTRTSILGRNIRQDVTYLGTVDITITECISRGIAQLENGTLIKLSEENYMDLLAKFLRFKVDNPKVAKIIRSVFGYATDGYPIDMYNPAPSVMHHPQTSLRDPIYWYLIQRVVDYFMLYTNDTKRYDLSKYETNDLTITDIEVSKIYTTFEYYLINLEKSLSADPSVHASKLINIFARQKRLVHKPFAVNFSVDSKIDKNVFVRIFLGPLCSFDDCWKIHSKFFQLDCYRYQLNAGSNNITWTPDTSLRYSSDNSNFNKTMIHDNLEKSYDIFKFPKNLVIPKGREDGLNLTMFIMIDEEEYYRDYQFSTLYMQVTHEVSKKPLGFPFHRQVDIMSVKDNASNYRFFNITVFHIKINPDDTGYFSPYLY